MAQKATRYGELWNREELILAFELYFRTPFAKTKANNPEVIKLATALGRSPASVARKLGNLGSFDPNLKAREISGLGHTSKLDESVWNEFHSSWSALVEEASKLKEKFEVATEMEDELEAAAPGGPSEQIVLAKRRLHQSFFRDAVRANYDNRCCLTGLGVRECLIASHIVPWSRSSQDRADPTNGVCLSATFDRLFDTGLMSISQEMTAVFARRLKKNADKRTQDLVLCYEGRHLAIPRKLPPSRERLAWHFENIFKG